LRLPATDRRRRAARRLCLPRTGQTGVAISYNNCGDSISIAVHGRAGDCR
jgi:hypothetical protein